MKFQKVDPKEMPKVIAMGVLALGVLGYAGSSLLGSGAPPPPPAAGGSKAGDQAGADGAAPGAPSELSALQLPPTFRADPFRPAVPRVRGGATPVPPPAAASGRQANGSAPTPAPRVVPRITTVSPGTRPFPVRVGNLVGPTRWLVGDGSSRLLRGPSTGAPDAAAPQQPSAPPPPVPPSIVVTGIVDTDDEDLALIELGTEKRVVRVGDEVGNLFHVKAIAANGIWVAKGKYKVFVVLGARPQAAPDTDPASANPSS